MEKDSIHRDDFLGRLISEIPLESPSDNFTSNVMERIALEPLHVTEKKPFYLYLKSWLPWVLLSVAMIIFLFTSDIPFLEAFPGKRYFTDSLGPYILSLFSGFKPLFEGGKVASYTLMILMAGGGLLGLDYFLKRRMSPRHTA